MGDPLRNRQARYARGRRAEAAVADFLVAKGYSILFSNLRVGPGELDLVARKGPLVAVVEVRTRGQGSREGAFESVGKAKRERLLAATDALWRERLASMPEVERVRIDVAAVRFEGELTCVEYVEGAVVGDGGRS